MNDREPLQMTMLADRVRALHIHERNGYGPGDCHCDECQETMDEIRLLDMFIMDCQAKGIPTPYDTWTPAASEWSC